MAGLAIVFYNKDLPTQISPLPRYFDLNLYKNEGVPFTLPSNMLAALKSSLETMNPEIRYKEITDLADWLSDQLKAMRLNPIAEEKIRFPGVFTLSIPSHLNSEKIGNALEKSGWLLNYQSEYLLKRNLVQIALLGNITQGDLEKLPDSLVAQFKNAPSITCRTGDAELSH